MTGRSVGDRDTETHDIRMRAPEPLVASIDWLVERGEYDTRSEAIRAAMRMLLRARHEESVPIPDKVHRHYQRAQMHEQASRDGGER